MDAEVKRRGQSKLFDTATRVSLARVVAKHDTTRIMSDGSSLARRVEVMPLAAFKGDMSSSERAVALEDKGITSCGRFGAGSATWAGVGSYVILFEKADPDAYTGSVGVLLSELREPRIIGKFDEVARLADLLLRQ
jgi:hypothetical protein